MSLLKMSAFSRLLLWNVKDIEGISVENRHRKKKIAHHRASTSRHDIEFRSLPRFPNREHCRTESHSRVGGCLHIQQAPGHANGNQHQSLNTPAMACPLAVPGLGRPGCCVFPIRKSDFDVEARWCAIFFFRCRFSTGIPSMSLHSFSTSSLQAHFQRIKVRGK